MNFANHKIHPVTELRRTRRTKRDADATGTIDVRKLLALDCRGNSRFRLFIGHAHGGRLDRRAA